MSVDNSTGSHGCRRRCFRANCADRRCCKAVDVRVVTVDSDTVVPVVGDSVVNVVGVVVLSDTHRIDTFLKS